MSVTYVNNTALKANRSLSNSKHVSRILPHGVSSNYAEIRLHRQSHVKFESYTANPSPEIAWKIMDVLLFFFRKATRLPFKNGRPQTTDSPIRRRSRK
jgi:hypothetical protein